MNDWDNYNLEFLFLILLYKLYFLSQLSWEEVQHVIESYGFQILEMEWREVTYARRPSAMMWNVYRAIYFTAKKL